MNTAEKLPVVAGVEIAQDADGRYNLNALHQASETPASKKPSEWLRLAQTQELIVEVEAQSGDSRFGARCDQACRRSGAMLG